METKIRILTVDPNREFCRQLTELVAAEGDMEVVGTASDGLEALERAAELKPDLILLELVLPKLDGLEVLRRLPDTGGRCRVIVLSGFVNGKVIAECSDCGADYFIPKPCDIQSLISRIRQLILICRAPRASAWTSARAPRVRARTRISRRSSPTSSMRSACPRTSRAISTCARPSSSPSRTWT